MEWWRDMFAIPLWQRLQVGWEDADDADVDAEQVVRALGLGARARVLDVPCGTGRIGTRLRTLGHRVVGIDATDRFVDVARRPRTPAYPAGPRACSMPVRAAGPAFRRRGPVR